MPPRPRSSATGSHRPTTPGIQIGAAVNEPPRLVAHDHTPIQAGMVFAVEPGAYAGPGGTLRGALGEDGAGLRSGGQQPHGSRSAEPADRARPARGSIPRLSSRIEVDAELERIVGKATNQLPVDPMPSADATSRSRALPERSVGQLARSGRAAHASVGQRAGRTPARDRHGRRWPSAKISALLERESLQLRIAPESGVSERPRSLRSFSPTPGPFLAASSTTSAPAAGLFELGFGAAAAAGGRSG